MEGFTHDTNKIYKQYHTRNFNKNKHITAGKESVKYMTLKTTKGF